MQIHTKIKMVCWKKFSILEDFFTSMISWNTWYARRRLVSAKFRKIPMKEATTDSSVGSFWDSQLGSTPKRYVKLRKGFTVSTNDGCLTLWNADWRIVQWTTHWQGSRNVGQSRQRNEMWILTMAPICWTPRWYTLWVNQTLKRGNL